MILPNFFCGGAPKSGTTTLYDILKYHPDIFLPKFKEPFFFNLDNHYNKGAKWYSNTYFSDYNGQKLIGDFTPLYLAGDEVPSRILHTIGKNAKFIFILRNPVDRAYSHYLHNKRDLMEDLSFSVALEKETSRVHDYLKTNRQPLALKFGYIKQGNYSAGIEQYFRLFGEENVKVFVFEELFSNVEKYISEILQFLGVEFSEILQVDIKSNPSSVPKSKFLKKILAKDSFIKAITKKVIPSMVLRKKIRKFIQRKNNTPQEYEKLPLQQKRDIFSQYFKEDVEKLSKLLNRNFNCWEV